MRKTEGQSSTQAEPARPGGHFAPASWQACLIICLVCGLVYYKAVSFGYTFMDDYGLIVENFRFLGRIGNLPKAFGLDVFGLRYGGMYRPVLTVSLMLDAWRAGINPWPYHLTNIALHAANGCLLYHLLAGLGKNKKAALAAALIFMVHPALATAVAWIGGRNDSLLTFWVLISFIALVRFSRNRRYLWAIVSLLAWGLALFTKESALLFPAAGSAYLWILGKGDNIRKELRFLIPGWIAMGSLFLAARWNVARPGLSSDPLFLSTLTENINGLLSYIYKAFIPVRLSVYAGYDRANFWLGASVLVFLIVWFSWRGIRDKRMFLFGLGWFLLFLVPYAWRGVDYANFLEHRLYLPAIGLILMLMESRPIPGLKPRLNIGIWCAVIAVLGTLTLARIPVFADGLVFWESAAKSSPRLYCVHDVLGKVYYDRGDLDRARREFRNTLALKPGYPYSLNNLGMVFLREGRADSALGYFRQALRTEPGYAEAWSNLGTVHYQLWQLDSAKQDFIISIRADSGNATACNGLGMVYDGQDSLGPAEAWYLRSARLDPLNAAPAWFNLGSLYLRTSQPEKAMDSFERVVRLDPDNVPAHRELGMIHLKMKELPQARAELEKALALAPNDSAINNYLALVHFGLGDRSRAAGYYRRAVQLGLKPDPRILKMLGDPGK